MYDSFSTLYYQDGAVVGHTRTPEAAIAHQAKWASISTCTQPHRTGPAVVPHAETNFSAEVTAAGWICALHQENIRNVESSSLWCKYQRWEKGD